MNEQFTTSDIVEGTNMDTNSPAENSDPFTDKLPVDAALISETPIGETIAAVSPMSWPLADETPMVEPPVHEIPMQGTVAAVSPMSWPLADEVPMVEPPVREFAMGETAAAVGPMVETFVPAAPTSETIIPKAPISTNAGSSTALLNREESEHFRTRWNEIQGKFVDEPRAAVQQADALVSEVIEQITQLFTNEHNSLEGQWNQGTDVSTEDLRKALQSYRSFFNRLVV